MFKKIFKTTVLKKSNYFAVRKIDVSFNDVFCLKECHVIFEM